MKNILIIDDQKEVLNLLRLALSTYGFLVEIAQGSLEGVKKFDCGNFDMVITAINMSKHSGNEVCEYVRKSNTPNIKVIGMSEDLPALSDNQFDKIIQRPFPLKKFLEQVQDIFRENDKRKGIKIKPHKTSLVSTVYISASSIL